MAIYTYRDFRTVLSRSGFQLVRSKKHETWQKIFPDGSILQVRVSHQYHTDILRPLFGKMLRQAGLTEEEFVRILRS